MKRTKYNLSHYNLLTGEMGRLYPIGLTEVLPGDTIQHHANVLIRVSPMAAPVMHPVTARVHHFFIPNRILWSENQDGSGTGGWENFVTGGPDGNNSEIPPQYTTVDYKTAGDANGQYLQDYFNIPSVAGINVNRLPWEAYREVYNEFYRDQDLQEKPSIVDFVQNIAWGKDYFTTARPWPQKGSDVTIPLGDLAPITGIGKANPTWAFTNVPVYETDGSNQTYDSASKLNSDQDANSFYVEKGEGGAYPAIYADLAQATGANINDVRRAFAIQRYQEARARYGSRYVEYLRYLVPGLKPSDARLQRPEFLGGGSSKLNFSEVLQTGPETGTQPSNEFGVGDMYGHGIAAMRSNKYRRFFEEHGYVLSLLSVRPESIYQDGIDRHFLKTDKESYYQRELTHIGQQEIYNNEVYADSSVAGMETFGYSDRYDEYRWNRSHVCGEFRDTLDYWHMARKFDSPPTLNKDFIRCEPTKRIYNEQTQHPLWIMVQHKMIARRVLTANASGRVI